MNRGLVYSFEMKDPISLGTDFNNLYLSKIIGYMDMIKLDPNMPNRMAGLGYVSGMSDHDYYVFRRVGSDIDSIFICADWINLNTLQTVTDGRVDFNLTILDTDQEDRDLVIAYLNRIGLSHILT